MTKIYSNIRNSLSPIIMGIVNVTPDSFSDGGKYFNTENAVKHALELVDDGAEIIDIGGESTRPGSEFISANEEIDRVIPVIAKLISKKPNIKISIDTTKGEVAEEALKVGACIINDISGGTFDENIFSIASKFKTPFIIMHIKGQPNNMQNNPEYTDVIEEISSFFENRIAAAKKYNVSEIILDPGIGFGKSIKDNYKILNNLDYFEKYKYPILMGVSKKSFIGNSLDLGINERENASTISETISIMKGAKIIRTHNVKNAVQIKKIVSLLNQ